MRVVALVICCLLVLSAFVMPAEAKQTKEGVYYSPNGAIPDAYIDYINDQKCLKHRHQYSDEVADRDDPLGIGIDLTVWEDSNEDAIVEDVEIQTKYDFANDEASVFAVVQVNLWKFFTGE